jgi:hypothetical protein
MHAVGAIPERRMDLSAAPQSKDAATGVYANTADVDCARCKCDLWLSAVVSPAAPDVAVCPEHADVLVREHNCPADSLVLVYRYTPEVGGVRCLTFSDSGGMVVFRAGVSSCLYSHGRYCCCSGCSGCG